MIETKFWRSCALVLIGFAILVLLLGIYTHELLNGFSACGLVIMSLFVGVASAYEKKNEF